ncbi:Nicotinate phosphoribosyltransferase OS=Streptomyces microflavus OX=1919 GN=G3I39_06245 PE=3 SV=1 [Streptomyces microflavus]
MNSADLGRRVGVPSTALFTDQYELTMVQAALKAGTADRHSVFEAFTRRLPEGRRYGVVAGTGRVLDAVENFHFDDEMIGFLRQQHIVDEPTLQLLADYRFSGDIWGYPEGEVYFPGLADPAGGGLLRRVRAAGDGDPLHPQPRLRDRGRRLADVGRRGGPPADRDGGAADSRAVGGGLGACGVRRRVRRHPLRHLAAGFRYGIPTVGTSARTPSPCCTTPSGTRSGRRWTRWGGARRCWSTRTT